MRFFRLLTIATVLGLLFMLQAPVPKADAVVASLGQALSDTPCDTVNNGDYRSLIQVSVASGGPNYVVPANGWLTKWSVDAPPMNPNYHYYPDTVSMQVQFQVWRPVAGPVTDVTYQLVYISGLETLDLPDTPQLQEFTLTPPVPVQGGDVIGLGIATDGAMCTNFAAGVEDVARVLNGQRYSVDTSPQQDPPLVGQNYNWANSTDIAPIVPIGGNGDTYFYTHVNVAAAYTDVIVPPVPAECAGMAPFNKTIVGTPGDDTLNGTPGKDLIFGLGGRDTINGGLGDDCIVGGDETPFACVDTASTALICSLTDIPNPGDTIQGGQGNDRILGGDGEDYIDGGIDNDLIWGGDDSDTLNGGNGNDTIHGGAYGDIIDGGNDADILFGDAGPDTIKGVNGNDQLYGDSDSSSTDTDGSTDTLNGGTGSDKCVGNSKIACES